MTLIAEPDAASRERPKNGETNKSLVTKAVYRLLTMRCKRFIPPCSTVEVDVALHLPLIAAAAARRKI